MFWALWLSGEEWLCLVMAFGMDCEVHLHIGSVKQESRSHTAKY